MANPNPKRGHFNNACFYYNPATQSISTNRTSKADLYFQSKHEFAVYRAILKEVKREYLKLQVPYEIKKRTVRFPRIYWKVDFVVPRLPRPSGGISDEILIEAKGTPTREFKRDIQFFEYQHPDEYQKLVLVSENQLDFPDIPCIKVSELGKYIRDRIS